MQNTTTYGRHGATFEMSYLGLLGAKYDQLEASIKDSTLATSFWGIETLIGS